MDLQKSKKLLKLKSLPLSDLNTLTCLPLSFSTNALNFLKIPNVLDLCFKRQIHFFRVQQIYASRDRSIFLNVDSILQSTSAHISNAKAKTNLDSQLCRPLHNHVHYSLMSVDTSCFFVLSTFSIRYLLHELSTILHTFLLNVTTQYLSTSCPTLNKLHFKQGTCYKLHFKQGT